MALPEGVCVTSFFSSIVFTFSHTPVPHYNLVLQTASSLQWQYSSYGRPVMIPWCPFLKRDQRLILPHRAINAPWCSPEHVRTTVRPTRLHEKVSPQLVVLPSTLIHPTPAPLIGHPSLPTICSTHCQCLPYPDSLSGPDAVTRSLWYLNHPGH